MKRLMAAIVLVLALGACEARAEIDVNDNGSGTFGFAFFIDKQFIALMEGFGGRQGEDPFGDFKSGLDDSPVPFQIEEYSENGGRGIRAKVPFKSVDDLRTIMKEVDQGDAQGSPLGGGGPGFGTFTLEQRGGGWYFESLSDAPDLGDLGDLGSGEGGGEAPFDPAQIASLLKISFRVTLPGRTVDTTADEATSKGGKTTFVWNADLTSKEPMQMVATTAAAGSSLPLSPILIALALIAALVTVAVMMRRKNAVASGPDQHADAWPSGTGGAVPPQPGTVPPVSGTHEQDPQRPLEPPAP
ncbi:MAG TPA: hypothetical protein VM841_13625 [Actinomycetota bacterium]|nr:hypothetical protein [Actinomycetota bacterium]